MFTHKIFSFFVAVFMVIAVFSQTAHAQTLQSRPNIQTFSTATSSTVIITSPSGYKSQVISTYDGKQFHTYATSTPLTSTDIQNLQANIQAEQTAMQQLFQQEENLLNEQNQLFQNIWNNVGM